MKHIWATKYNNNKRLDTVSKCWMFIHHLNIVTDKDIIQYRQEDSRDALVADQPIYVHRTLSLRVLWCLISTYIIISKLSLDGG